MKVCPSCKKTYADDSLNFCLDDGSILTASAPIGDATLVMPPAQPTAPSGFGSQGPASTPGGFGSEGPASTPSGFGSQGPASTPSGFGSTGAPTAPSTPTVLAGGVRSSFGSEGTYPAAAPRKSSKTWMWIVGILALVMLVCGGGIAAVVGVSYWPSDPGTNVTTPTPGPGNNRGQVSPTPFQSKDVQVIDLSEWVRDSSAYGATEFTGGEFIMRSKQTGFYYVLVAPEEYKTEGTTTKVTARNLSSTASDLGFGLIFHSDTSPLVKDYAFLIDSQRGRYRVVRHEPEKETVVLGWTKSAAIKNGSVENVLEIRDSGDETTLFVNGTELTSVKNTSGFKGGVAGLYTGDGIKIAFKNLEITK